MTNPTITVNGQFHQFGKTQDFMGFGRRKSEMGKLKAYLHRKQYEAMTSFSGSVDAREWTLKVGINYKCKSRMNTQPPGTCVQR